MSNQPRKFAPKEAVALAPPRSDPITRQQLANYDGVRDPRIYVAINGTVFDVSRNREKYAAGEGYSVFVGRDASIALAKSSLDPTIYSQGLSLANLTDKERKTLDDWYSFFVQRYNVVGVLVD